MENNEAKKNEALEAQQKTEEPRGPSGEDAARRALLAEDQVVLQEDGTRTASKTIWDEVQRVGQDRSDPLNTAMLEAAIQVGADPKLQEYIDQLPNKGSDHLTGGVPEGYFTRTEKGEIIPIANSNLTDQSFMGAADRQYSHVLPEVIVDALGPDRIQQALDQRDAVEVYQGRRQIAYQDQTPEALAAKEQVLDGTPIYRTVQQKAGETEAGAIERAKDGPYWSMTDPAELGYRENMGVSRDRWPPTHVAVAELKPDAWVVTGHSLPEKDSPGGIMQVAISRPAADQAAIVKVHTWDDLQRLRHD